ncbi:MAG TPA: hypothetical protein VF765_33155 [Polyangiaceae bacterium]
MKPILDELEERIERAFRAAQHDEARFPLMACEALDRARLHEKITPEQILAWMCSDERLPEASDPESRFGQPSVTLRSADRFVVDALFWFDGTTSIHDHAFSGAFCLLHGSSIHTRYTFAERAVLSSRMAIGELARNETELLRRGDVRPIAGGAALTHSLFHLDRPSVSLVVRTRSEPAHLPQHRYFPPGVRVAPRPPDQRNLARVRALRVLRECASSAFEANLSRAIRATDLQGAFEIGLELSGDPAVREQVGGLVEEVHGAVAAVIRPALRQAARQEQLIQMRSRFRDPGHRFFLGVLLNAPDREAARRLIAAREEGDPMRNVLRWVRELSALPSTVSPTEPNALNLPLDEAALAFLEAWLAAPTEAELARRVGELTDHDPEQIALATRFFGLVRRHPLFESLA